MPRGKPGICELDNLIRNFSNYLNEGGFPEVVLLSNGELKNEILQNYVHVVLLRDVIERHSVSNEQALRYFTKSLLSLSGRLMSVNKIYQDLKSQGLSVGKDSLYQYLDYLEESFLIFSVTLFSESIRKQQTHLKKIYSIDNGLSRAFMIRKNSDLGNSFENQIFLDLRRNRFQIFYYKTKSDHEIDFVVRRGSHPYRAFQVSLDPAAGGEENEIQASKELLHELGISLEHVHPRNYLQFLVSLTYSPSQNSHPNRLGEDSL